MNDNTYDFEKLNSQIVAEWPDWKRQYDLRVSSYGPDPMEAEAAAHGAEAVIADRSSEGS